MTKTIAVLLGAATISWIVTRPAQPDGEGLCLVDRGVLLCLTVGALMQQDAREADEMKQLLRKAVALEAQWVRKLEDVDKRLAEVDVAQYMTPAMLTAPKQLVVGQEQLKRYRGLLAERTRVMQEIESQNTAFFATLPESEARNTAFAKDQLSRSMGRNVYSVLDKAQNAHADAIGDMLSWAQANSATISMSGNGLRLQTKAQQEQLRILLANLSNAHRKASDAMDQVVAYGNSREKEAEALAKRAQAILAD